MNRWNHKNHDQDDLEEREQIQVALIEEVKEIYFTETMRAKVLDQLKPSFWERKIVVPIPAIVLILLVIIAIGIKGWGPLLDSSLSTQNKGTSSSHTVKINEEENELIVLSTGVFRAADLKKGMKR